MALIMSLFSDAEMIGMASGAASSSASVCATDSVAVPNESAPRAEAHTSFIDEWINGFQTNMIEERERLGSIDSYVVNPCVHCQYHDLCDTDDCAMKIGSLDMNHAPTSRGWRNFGL